MVHTPALLFDCRHYRSSPVPAAPSVQRIRFPMTERLIATRNRIHLCSSTLLNFPSIRFNYACASRIPHSTGMMHSRRLAGCSETHPIGHIVCSISAEYQHAFSAHKITGSISRCSISDTRSYLFDLHSRLVVEPTCCGLDCIHRRL